MHLDHLFHSETCKTDVKCVDAETASTATSCCLDQGNIGCHFVCGLDELHGLNLMEKVQFNVLWFCWRKAVHLFDVLRKP